MCHRNRGDLDQRGGAEGGRWGAEDGGLCLYKRADREAGAAGRASAHAGTQGGEGSLGGTAAAVVNFTRGTFTPVGPAHPASLPGAPRRGPLVCIYLPVSWRGD